MHACVPQNADPASATSVMDPSAYPAAATIAEGRRHCELAPSPRATYSRALERDLCCCLRVARGAARWRAGAAGPRLLLLRCLARPAYGRTSAAPLTTLCC